MAVRSYPSRGRDVWIVTFRDGDRTYNLKDPMSNPVRNNIVPVLKFQQKDHALRANLMLTYVKTGKYHCHAVGSTKALGMLDERLKTVVIMALRLVAQGNTTRLARLRRLLSWYPNLREDFPKAPLAASC